MGAPKGHAPYNKNGEGGRPKIYDDKFIENEAIALEKWIEIKENIFLEDFSLERGYGDARISEFTKANKRFAEAIDKFKIKQRGALFKGSLNKRYSFPAASLILGHYHGIYAKTEQKVSGQSDDLIQATLKKADGNSKELVDESE